MARHHFAINGAWTSQVAYWWQVHLKNEGHYWGRIDGDFGSVSQTALQRNMKYHGHYSGAIDGWFGSMSLRSLYNYLVTHWGAGSYLAEVGQSQRYSSPWNPSRNKFVVATTRAVQSGLNRHGRY